MREKRHRNKEEFRREILDAAREIFSSDGYENFSMRKLARRIGYSPTTIYLYFKDKDQLLFCLCEEMFAEQYRELRIIEEEGTDLPGTLRRVLVTYVRLALKTPDRYRIAYFTNSSVYGSPDEFLGKDTMSRRVYLRYRDLVLRCRDAGFLAHTDGEVLAQVLWAGVHGIVSVALHSRDFPLVDPLVLTEVMVDRLLKGFQV